MMLFGCCFSMEAMAESSVGDIYISVVQPERNDIPQEAASQLENRMHQLITANGIADTDPACIRQRSSQHSSCQGYPHCRD